MPKRCVVGKCGAVNKDGISLHKFPKDEKLRRLWTKFVLLTRRDFTNPSSFSCICRLHFTPECFKRNPVAESLGFGARYPELLEDAVPTLRKGLEKSKGALPNSPDPSSADFGESLRQKEPRLAFQKLQHARTITTASLESDPVKEEPNLDICNLIDMPTQHRSPTTRTVKIQAHVKGASKGSQASVSTVSIGIQCNILRPIVSTPINSDDEDDDTSGLMPYDESFHLNESELDESLEYDTVDGTSTEHFGDRQRKFIVYEKNLMELFVLCSICFASGCKATITSIVGALITVEQLCHKCGEIRRWSTGPYTGGVPSCNLMLSGAILFSGGLPGRILKCLKFLGLTVYSSRTYFRHQNSFLCPSVLSVWQSETETIVKEMKENDAEIVVGGDARCDSMGHSAKYGSYSFVELNLNKVIDTELVQSNEVGGSYHMELEGLKRITARMKKQDVNISAIVTDGHRSIQKWLRENCGDIKHFLDVWHVAKGVTKKMDALAKQPRCSLVASWMQSITNHMYWCAATSYDDADLMLAKWDSVVNHICDCHEGHSDVFPKCLHGPLDGDDRDWFQAGTEPYERLSQVLQSTYLRSSIKKLSPCGQTSAVEGYHSLVNHFAPKMYHFSFQSMKARLHLAALHFNENAGRDQAKSSKGNLEYKIVFPKYKRGGHIVRKISTDCTYDYVTKLFDELFARAEHSIGEVLRDIPKALCSQYEHPPKEEAIRMMMSRFAHNK